MCYTWMYPDSKFHMAQMGPTWVLSAPGGPHVGPMNLAIRVLHGSWAACTHSIHQATSASKSCLLDQDCMTKNLLTDNYCIIYCHDVQSRWFLLGWYMTRYLYIKFIIWTLQYLLMKLYVRKRESDADCELTTYSSPLAQAIYAVFVVNCRYAKQLWHIIFIIIGLDTGYWTTGSKYCCSKWPCSIYLYSTVCQ